MKFIKHITLTLATVSLCILGSSTFAQNQAASLAELQTLVNERRLSETDEMRQREQQFQQNVNQRQALLNEMEQRREAEEAESVRLEAVYNENELIKAQRFETLQERKGDLRIVRYHQWRCKRYPFNF